MFDQFACSRFRVVKKVDFLVCIAKREETMPLCGGKSHNFLQGVVLKLPGSRTLDLDSLLLLPFEHQDLQRNFNFNPPLKRRVRRLGVSSLQGAKKQELLGRVL